MDFNTHENTNVNDDGLQQHTKTAMSRTMDFETPEGAFQDINAIYC
jgi:hypothetical protein